MSNNLPDTSETEDTTKMGQNSIDFSHEDNHEFKKIVGDLAKGKRSNVV